MGHCYLLLTWSRSISWRRAALRPSASRACVIEYLVSVRGKVRVRVRVRARVRVGVGVRVIGRA